MNTKFLIKVIKNEVKQRKRENLPSLNSEQIIELTKIAMCDHSEITERADGQVMIGKNMSVWVLPGPTTTCLKCSSDLPPQFMRRMK